MIQLNFVKCEFLCVAYIEVWANRLIYRRFSAIYI